MPEAEGEQPTTNSVTKGTADSTTSQHGGGNNNTIEEVKRTDRDGNDTTTGADDETPHTYKVPRAPPHIYACFVKNLTDHSTDVCLEWYGRPNEHEFDELNHFTLQPQEEKHTQRKIFQPDLPKNPGEEFDHDKHSYCSWVKILNRVTVEHKGANNKKKMEIVYPFENVHCPIRNWEFHVTDMHIESHPPTRPVNVLKYENLTDIEK
ncbi:unnamed protein product [Didymodactylos carnosus]|uniref:Uncharacterized protein n=1 Tax=Didymodactylos carnosus TaxID=1234261 RepID=A0A814JN40_9BILA|nr:unnamed protein product [Didymodactylos carnosus]CAF1038063.1 unnamed protein product [Didymodactylos carnosus]CAF3548529.1 unnamed protein product [Didymodactylos carnosus]CAF3808530.1 unnamed protein product [Didymodactylos carnosus]